jgi:hypothetical protein
MTRGSLFHKTISFMSTQIIANCGNKTNSMYVDIYKEYLIHTISYLITYRRYVLFVSYGNQVMSTLLRTTSEELLRHLLCNKLSFACATSHAWEDVKVDLLPSLSGKHTLSKLHWQAVKHKKEEEKKKERKNWSPVVPAGLKKRCSRDRPFAVCGWKNQREGGRERGEKLGRGPEDS